MKIWAMPVARPYIAERRRAAELIQADFAKVGVTAEIVSYEWAEYLKRVARTRIATAPSCSAGPATTAIRTTSSTSLLGCDAVGGNNRAQWCNKEFDDLIAKAKATIGPRPSAPSSMNRRRSSSSSEAPWATIAHSKVFMPMQQEGHRLRDGSARHPSLRRRRHRRIRHRVDGAAPARGAALLDQTAMLRYLLRVQHRRPDPDLHRRLPRSPSPLSAAARRSGR